MTINLKKIIESCMFSKHETLDIFFMNYQKLLLKIAPVPATNIDI